MSICPCPNCRTASASVVHSLLGWLLLLAALVVAVGAAYSLIESLATALLIPTAVIAAGMIAVVTRMVLKRPTRRTVATPARTPMPAAEASEAPPAPATTPDASLAHLGAFTVELARAAAPFN